MDLNETKKRCAEMLQREDRDRYLTSLFAPPGVRFRLHALYAFNLELARVAEVVSEPMLGEIRLQWWRETLDGVFAGTPRRHDVAEALAALVAEGHLAKTILDRMVDARAVELEDVPFEIMDDLVTYLGDSSSALMAQSAELLDPGHDPGAAGPGGIAVGLVGLVRAIGYHARQGRVMMPRDLMTAHDVDPHDLINGRAGDNIRALVRDMLEQAERQMGEFRRAASAIPKAASPAYLPVTLAASDLKTIRRAGYDPFRIDAQPRPGRVARLILRGVLGRP